jgi:hypothetical protein
MSGEISTFGFVGDSDTNLPDLALELADVGLLAPVETVARIDLLPAHYESESPRLGPSHRVPPCPTKTERHNGSSSVAGKG